MGRWLIGFLWKDVKLFGVDRQALVMSFVVPVLIASILSWLDSSASNPTAHVKVPFLFVDLDQSDVSRSLLEKLRANDSVEPKVVSEEEAEGQVRSGSALAAAIVPKGFGPQAVKGLSGGPKPEIQLLLDPSKPSETELVHGIVTGEASSATAVAAYGALASIDTAPVTVKDVPAAAAHVGWSSAAHDYAGFGMQGLLFFAIEAAIGLSRERRQGIWKRLRVSPVPPSFMLFAKGVSASILAFAVLGGIFAIGAGLFGIRVLGSWVGFLLLMIAISMMSATFGLALSTVGKTETQSRGISILLILVMLATGGAWFPMAQMPPWVQTMARFLPVKWAVEGIDAMTWRGGSLSGLLPTLGALLGFCVVFGSLAILRFRTLAESN